jgi:prepilin-type processing-associated H-X9-DG protein
MIDWEAGEPWRLKPTTLYNLVRHPRMIEKYSGQPAEQEIWLLKDYAGFHGPKDSPRRVNFLYIDGHVADLER